MGIKKISIYSVVAWVSLFTFGIMDTHAQSCSTRTLRDGSSVTFCNSDTSGHDFWNRYVSNYSSPQDFYSAFAQGGRNHQDVDASQVHEDNSGVDITGNTLYPLGACAGAFCGSSSTSSTSSSSRAVTSPPSPPAPPSPITCSYISSWQENWSNCDMNGNVGDDGVMECEQTNTWEAVQSSYTTYGSCTNSDAVRPADQVDVMPVRMLLGNTNSTCIDIPADNVASCQVQVNLDMNLHQNRRLTGVNNFTLSNLQDASGEAADRINGGYNENNNSALNFSDVVISNIGEQAGNYYFLISNIKSRSPFSTANAQIDFSIAHNSGTSVDLTLSNVAYKFNKIVYGNLAASEDDGENWTAIPTIGNAYLYRLEIAPYIPFFQMSRLGNISMDNLTTSIAPFGNNLSIQDPQIISNALGSATPPSVDFSARINTGIADAEINTSPGLQLNFPSISYNLDGHRVTHVLSDGVDVDNQVPITIVGSDFKKVKVLGSTQFQGKLGKVSQDINISNMGTSQAANELRARIFTSISGLTAGDTVNGVRYIKGDYTLDGSDMNFETLIVEDGNLIIASNIDTSDLKGYIVVKSDSSYDVFDDYDTIGNVYINENVTYLRGAFYTDGAIISSANGTPYTSDSSQRTRNLSRQLVVKGTLFSKNTIGGSILSGGEYILPAGGRTNDFNLALVYDFNKIRTNSIGWDGNDTLGDGNAYNQGHDNPFVIIYDPEIQQNPPKIFAQ